MQHVEGTVVEGVDTDVRVLWNGALDILREGLSELVFTTWFRDAHPLGVVGSDVIVSVSNAFGRNWLQSRYTAPLSTALTQVAAVPMSVQFVVRTPEEEALQQAEMEASCRSEEHPVTPGASSQTRVEVHEPADGAPAGLGEPRQTFDNFVVGASNQLAYACAQAVAETPAFKYNPLFIYGGSGLGKTHLLRAIGHYIASYHPHLRVRFIDAQHMVDDFTDSLKSRSMESFRRRYRDNEVLLVDDVQALISKKETQEEFFRTFKLLQENHKQIVLTSDRPPYELETLSDRLKSRFSHGLIADINPPELETRVAILKRKLELEPGIPVPTEVLTIIAERASGNVRELEGALTRVRAFAQLTPGKVITVEHARDVLKGMFPEQVARPISIQTIQHEVCRFFSITMEDLKGSKRSQNVVFPRQVAMYLARELTDLSLPRIGAEFGGKDHSTVIHANAKITAMLGKDREVLNQIQTLTTAIRQKS